MLCHHRLQSPLELNSHRQLLLERAPNSAVQVCIAMDSNRDSPGCLSQSELGGKPENRRELLLAEEMPLWCLVDVLFHAVPWVKE